MTILTTFKPSADVARAYMTVLRKKIRTFALLKAHVREHYNHH